MDPQAIVYHLAQADGLPEAAIRAARERRAEAAPLLVDLVERYLAGDARAHEQRSALFFAFHLLGEWREPSAYRPLARLLATEEATLDALLGDAITATSHRVMAGVFDGDPQPLYDVIEAREADPFVRSRMLETLAMLVLEGALERDRVASYLRDAFMNLEPHADSFLWFGWQSAIAALGLEDLKGLVKKAFARGLIGPGEMSFADFQADLRYAVAHPESPWHRPAADEYAPFEDTIAELSSWYGFSSKDQGREDAWSSQAGLGEPAANPFRGVGRNDPCPCGSGKKFKKCCRP